MKKTKFIAVLLLVIVSLSLSGCQITESITAQKKITLLTADKDLNNVPRIGYEWLEPTEEKVTNETDLIVVGEFIGFESYGIKSSLFDSSFERFLCVGEFNVSQIILNKDNKVLNQTIKIIMPCENLAFNKGKETIEPITNSIYLDIQEQLILILREAKDGEDLKYTDYADYTLPNPFDYSIVNKGDMLLMSNFWQNEMDISNKITVEEFAQKTVDIICKNTKSVK